MFKGFYSIKLYSLYLLAEHRTVHGSIASECHGSEVSHRPGKLLHRLHVRDPGRC